MDERDSVRDWRQNSLMRAMAAALALYLCAFVFGVLGDLSAPEASERGAGTAGAVARVRIPPPLPPPIALANAAPRAAQTSPERRFRASRRLAAIERAEVVRFAPTPLPVMWRKGETAPLPAPPPLFDASI